MHLSHRYECGIEVATALHKRQAMGRFLDLLRATSKQSGSLNAPGLGLRHDTERRHADRRTTDRGDGDRRWSVRRRAKVRSLLFSALVFAIPHQLKPGARTAPHELEARVTTSVDNIFAIPASQAYNDLIHEAAALYRVSPTLIHSVMQAESAFDPTAISSAGAMGLMQLMPETAGAFGIADPFNPRENIMGGTRLLRELLDAHDNNIPIVLAAYNAGPTAVARYRGIPPFRETRGYVKKIINLINKARIEDGG